MAKNKMLLDSIALAFVRVLTMFTSIISTMILARFLPLTDIGTYSTGNLIINTATLVSAFGLIDAVNYFYNGKNSDQRDSYINTVFFMFVLCGVIIAIAIITCQELITAYFHNPKLASIYIYIAFRPLLHNVILGLQNLQVSIGKAKMVAVRNTFISLSKVFAVLLTVVFTKDVTTIFICMLLVEIISLVFYYKILNDNNVKINPAKINFNIVNEILYFCIPLGLYIQTNALSRDIDKFVIGYYESTEMLAVYSNCSTPLPFNIIAGPLLTLCIPLLTRCIRSNDYKSGSIVFQGYVKICYISTFIFGVACLFLSKQAILFLYGEKFLIGISVFAIYILVDMVNFINFALVLTSKGRTRTLVKVSTCALIANLVTNFLAYKLIGFTGPAIATLVITVVVNFILLKYSAVVLKITVKDLFDLKHIKRFICELIIVAIIITMFRLGLEFLNIHYALILIILGGSSVMCCLWLNKKSIKQTFDSVNHINTIIAK